MYIQYKIQFLAMLFHAFGYQHILFQISSAIQHICGASHFYRLNRHYCFIVYIYVFVRVSCAGVGALLLCLPLSEIRLLLNTQLMEQFTELFLRDRSTEYQSSNIQDLCAVYPKCSTYVQVVLSLTYVCWRPL